MTKKTIEELIYTNLKPIGFFDSGVGGLSVLSRFKKVLPDEFTIYFGDTIHLPYGNKTKEELIGYARKIMDFFQAKDVKAVIIACNTSSAQAYDTIKDDYKFPIYPIIQCSAKAITSLKIKRIGVFATEATVSSGKYTEELKRYNPEIRVKEIAAKNWVGIVEGVSQNLEEDLKNIKYEVEEMLTFDPYRIVLGCTHYPYLMNELAKYAPKEIFLDPAEIFVKYVKNDLIKRNLLLPKILEQERAEKFYVSANPEEFVEHAKIFYELKDFPTIVTL